MTKHTPSPAPRKGLISLGIATRETRGSLDQQQDGVQNQQRIAFPREL